MTQALQVPFGEWLPDLPAHENPGALIALNVVPQFKSYRSLNSLKTFSNALANVCLGTFWAQDASGAIRNFAGDTTRLYNLVTGTTWTDISGLAAPFNATNWEFTRFGETILAINASDPMQKYAMGVDAVFSTQPGSPPRAKRIATVRDFVMLGDIQNGVGAGPGNVQWSGFNNSQQWTPSLATQSDYQQLFGRGGRVQKIVPGEYAIIFQEQSLWRADYVGPPVVFQFDEIERKRGTPAPDSVIYSGGHVWYWGYDNFYHFDGAKSTPISANRVSRWFQLNGDQSVVDTMRGAIDRVNRLLIWAFRSSSSKIINDRLILYNWAADRWSYAEVDTQLIDEYVSPGFTLDQLDALLPGGIDANSIPVDSSAFKAGALNIIAFNGTNTAATFDGMALTATIDTKEISGPDHSRIYVNALRPLVEANGASTITVQVGTRNRLQDNTTFTPPKGINGVNGEINVRINSRYQRYRFQIAGGFEHGSGAKASVRMAGRR